MRAHDIKMQERTVWDCDLASIHCYDLIAMGSLVYVQNRWDETNSSWIIAPGMELKRRGMSS